MELARPHSECTIVQEQGFVRATVGSGGAEGRQECYRTLAVLLVQQKFDRALIVGLAQDDPIYHLAARDLVIALHVIGTAAGFKLAMVPRTDPTLNGFKHAEVEGQMRGLRVKVFSEEAQAIRWLREPDQH